MELKTEGYYESLDKRTSEYKDWKKASQGLAIGLGDTIEQITKSTGIKSLVEKLFGKDCGCDERKVKLNKLFKYKTECLTQEEFEYLDLLFSKPLIRLTTKQQSEIIPIYNRVFNTNQHRSSCVTCWIGIMASLKKLHKAYLDEL